MAERVGDFVLRSVLCLTADDTLASALAQLVDAPGLVVLVQERGQPLFALIAEMLPRLWLAGVSPQALLRSLSGLQIVNSPAAMPWSEAAAELVRDGECRILLVYDESGGLQGALNEEDLCRQLGASSLAAATQVMAAKQDSELRLQAVFDSTHVLLALLTPAGLVLDVNGVALAMVGARPEDVRGKPFWETPGWMHDPAQQERVKQAILQCSQGQTPSFEVCNSSSDAGLQWVDLALRPVRDEHGEVRYILAEGSNVSSRRQAESALANERAVLRSVFDTIPDLIFYKDANSVYRGCNRAFEKYFGKPESQIVGRTDFYFVNSDLASLFREKDAQSIASGETCVNEEWVTYPDGRRILLETMKTPIRDAGGRALGVLGVSRDITERRRLDEALRQSQERYRRLFENMPSGFVLLQLVLDMTGKAVDARYVEINPAYEQIIGQSAENLVGRTLRETYPSAEDAWLEAAGRVAFTGEPCVLDIYLRETGRWLKLHLFCPQRGFCAGVLQDTTEQREAAELLRRQRAQLRAILDNFPFPVWLKDREGHYLAVNYQLARQYGQDRPAALIGKTDFDFCAPDWAARYTREDREVMDSLQQKAMEQPIGEHGLWEEVFKTPILADDGALLGTAGFSRDISRRKRDEEALRSSQAHYQAVLDASPFGVLEIDADNHCVYANPRCLEMLGMSFEQLQGAAWMDGVHPKDRARVDAVRSRTFAEGVAGCVEYRRILPDGREIWVLGQGVPMRDAHGARSGIIVALLDITERKEAENQLKLAASIYETCGEGVMVLDASRRVISVNPAFSALLGYAPAEILGQDPAMLTAGDHHLPAYSQMWGEVEASGQWQGEIWGRRKDGSEVALWMTISTLCNRGGEVQWRFALFSDITGKKQAEELIWRQANYDSLTSLPNRRLFRDRLQIDIKKSLRSQRLLALFFIDLDHFKCVNDTLGHDCGDRLLAEAALRLRRCVRETDTVARMGGDEFTAILPLLPDASRAQVVAQSMLDALAQPFLLDGESVCISASVGIALFPKDGEDDISLLKQADRAMYLAKAKGRNAYSFLPD